MRFLRLCVNWADLGPIWAQVRLTLAGPDRTAS